jgi:ribosome-associated translation inhibitor RaiA
MLFSTSLNFAMQPGRIVVPKRNKAPNMSPRSGFPKNVLEVKDAEEPEEDLPELELPPYRAPYRLFLNSVGDAKIGERNQEHIKRKLEHALEKYDDNVQNVHIGVHVDSFHHSYVKPNGKTQQAVPMEEDGEEAPIVTQGSQPVKASQGKRLTTPFRIDVRVDMDNGNSFVVGRSKKSYSTLLEAVAAAYHDLKEQISVVQKRMTQKSNIPNAELDSHGGKIGVDDLAGPDASAIGEDIDAEYAQQIKAEAEQLYSSIPE